MAQKRTSTKQAGPVDRAAAQSAGGTSGPRPPSVWVRWLAPESRRVRLGAVVIALAVGAAYANSLSGPMIFDDIPGIIENPSIRSLWPPWQPLIPLSGGSSASGRPVVNLSLALNHAFGGLEVRGYHIFNLLVHLGAGLALFGIVRRTLGRMPGGLRTSALPLGFATALLWALHPLQTESVTSVIQRTESLAGLFYLITLYCFIRGTEPAAGPGSPSTGSGHSPPENMACHERRPNAGVEWLGLSVASCFLGVATKEILFTAPLILLLYDRTFVAGTFAEAWRRRGRFYGATILSWVLLAVLMGQSQNRGGTVTLGRGVNAWTSLLTQSDAVVMYLKLALWPRPLVLDYGDCFADLFTRLAEVLPQAVFLTGLAGVTVYALVRRPALGFVGAWFFIILAPSSSFVPLLSQIRAEHRMYLPLAAVVVVAVLFVHRVAGRIAPVVLAGLALALGVVTAARNADYRTARAIWTDTVQKRPDNPRPHNSLGLELARAGDHAGAIREYEEALRLYPGYVEARTNLARLLLSEGRRPEARAQIEAVVRLGPVTSNANNNLGHLLLLLDDPAGAIPPLEKALRLNPDNAEAHNNLGYALAARGSLAEAVEHFRRSTALLPDYRSYLNLGDALLRLGQVAEAQAGYAEAVRLQPDSAEAHFSLATTLRRLGRNTEARDSLHQVLRLDPNHAAAAEMLRALDGHP